MIGAILYNGISSEDVGLRVEHHPHRIIPARKMERVSVPGRNGDLIFVQNAYENYVQPYDVWIDPARRDYNGIMQAVAGWLNAARQYARLEDENDRDTYRLAYYAGGDEFDNRLILTGKGTLRFYCKPQRWLKSGEESVGLGASGAVLTNPTAFAALPYIKVYGSGAGELSVGEITCTLNDIDEYIELDSDLQNAYRGLENKNNTVNIPVFPSLKPGDNAIAWSGGITSVEIIPRWWTL